MGEVPACANFTNGMKLRGEDYSGEAVRDASRDELGPASCCVRTGIQMCVALFLGKVGRLERDDLVSYRYVFERRKR